MGGPILFERLDLRSQRMLTSRPLLNVRAQFVAVGFHRREPIGFFLTAKFLFDLRFQVRFFLFAQSRFRVRDPFYGFLLGNLRLLFGLRESRSRFLFGISRAFRASAIVATMPARRCALPLELR